MLASAALLHDIGTYVLFDDNGKVGNERLYPLHAILSAKIIADEGIDSRVASLVETHILLGLSKQEIIEKPWPLPARDYIPSSVEGELLCYADRFHSKRPTFNAYDTFLARLKEGLPERPPSSRSGQKDLVCPILKRSPRSISSQSGSTVIFNKIVSSCRS